MFDGGSTPAIPISPSSATLLTLERARRSTLASDAMLETRDPRRSHGLLHRVSVGALVLVASLGAVQVAQAHRVVATVPPAGTVEEPLPSGALARISTRLVSQRSFDHWFLVAADGMSPQPGSREHDGLRRETMEFLIQAAWVALEARKHRLALTRRAVRRTFARQKREAFRNEREYRRFVTRSPLTEGDLLFRVKLDMLQSRISRHVTRSAKSPAAKRRALNRSVREFRRRWRARTVCARGYVIADCSKEATPS